MLSGLKHRMEEGRMEKIFEIYIKATPERLWDAITDPEMRRSNLGVGSSRLDSGLPLRGIRDRRPSSAICEGKISRSTHRADSYRASGRSGAIT